MLSHDSSGKWKVWDSAMSDCNLNLKASFCEDDGLMVEVEEQQA